MDVLQQYTRILEQERVEELLPFLKSLEASRKKELAAGIKHLANDYLSYNTLSDNERRYGRRATPAQTDILGFTFFICYNKRDFENAEHTGIIEKSKLDNVLPWYCPVWFNDYINAPTDSLQPPFYLDYEWYTELVRNGYVLQSEQMLAILLPRSIFVTHTGKREINLRALLDRKESLDEHIWYLFYHESTIHWSDTSNWGTPKLGENLWKQAFKYFVDEKRMDRDRLLKECLLAANRNFPKTLSGWFTDLFVYLGPTKEEVKQLQNVLFPLLASPFSKPLQTALKYLKQLAPEPDFELDAFLENAGAILTSTTKSAISTVLIMFEKLARKYPDFREQICSLSCQAFIQQDHAIQLRAAKLIGKYAQDSEVISGEISAYWDALFFETKNLLSAFRAGDHQPEDLVAEEQAIGEEPTRKSLSSLAPIKQPETFDEVVFLASQAFDQNETYHFDLLPAALIRFQDQMTEENIARLEPAFQRAYKTVTSDWSSTRGYLDHMLAIFFINFGQILAKLYPERAASLTPMHQAFNDKEEQKKIEWKWHRNPICAIREWTIVSGSNVYTPYKSVLVQTIAILAKKIKLPLLSTPTHEPCWIDPATLIERLSLYQAVKTLPDEFDFQIAISRCLIDDAQDFKNLVNAEIAEEFQSILLTLAGETVNLPEWAQLKPVWLTAAANAGKLSRSLSKISSLPGSFISGRFEWHAAVEPCVREVFDYELMNYVRVPDTRKVIRITLAQKPRRHAITQAILKFLPAREKVECLYEFIDLKFKHISAEHNDIKRLLYYIPRNSEIHIAHIIATCLESPDLTGESVKKVLINTFEALLVLRQPFGPMGHLLVGACMICSDKVIRNYAAEVWITGITNHTIDSKLIGEAIGKLEQVEIAPIKRFTDLVIGCMIQISSLHNDALRGLLTALLETLPAKPINNLKKLLEIYTEVVSITTLQPLDAPILAKLSLWKTTDSLTKTIDKLIKVQAR